VEHIEHVLMDTLKYADTLLVLCFAGMSRRDSHDALRQIYNYRDRIRVCPCVTDVWIRESLTILGAVFDNEPSHPVNRLKSD
jgi:hypothetical protein